MLTRQQRELETDVAYKNGGCGLRGCAGGVNFKAFEIEPGGGCGDVFG